MILSKTLTVVRNKLR